jgi:hypothetical protein
MPFCKYSRLTFAANLNYDHYTTWIIFKIREEKATACFIY